MSAYSEVALPHDFKDGELLILALKEMGFQPVNCIGAPKPLWAYDDTYRTKDGKGHTTKVEEAMHADIIIPRAQVGGASNDIGFVRGKDGHYTAIISQYDSQRYNGEWVKKLRNGYHEQNILRTGQRQGLRYLGKTKAGNKTKYKFSQA